MKIYVLQESSADSEDYFQYHSAYSSAEKAEEAMKFYAERDQDSSFLLVEEEIDKPLKGE